MRSDKMTKGPSAAPRLALMKALGLTDEEIDRPLIGIVSSKNDIVPGHMNLDKVVDAVKQGVALAGGVPLVFPAIAVCDGLAMGHEGMKYSLVSRELIADSTESMAIAHPFDGLVMVAACDKNVPGLVIADEPASIFRRLSFPAARCLAATSRGIRLRSLPSLKRSAHSTPERCPRRNSAVS